MSLGSLGIPLHQWIQKLQIEIHQVLGKYRTVCVHRAKFTRLCSELRTFYRKLTSKTYCARTVTPSESTKFRQLISIVAEVGHVFTSLSEQNLMSCIDTHNNNYVTSFIAEFRNNFNDLVTTLSIKKKPPLNTSSELLEEEDFSDSKALLQKLDEYDPTPRLNEYINFLKEKICLYRESTKEQKEKQDKKVRYLSDKEITKELKELSRYQYEPGDFEIQKKVGSGGYSDVFCAINKQTGRIVAVKRLITNDLTESAFGAFKREIEMLSKYKHFAILPFVGFIKERPFSIITDFMSGGSLYSRLHSSTHPLSSTQLTIIALGIAYGMQFLHQNGMTHRDLKSLNILLDADSFPRICDFGTAPVTDGTNETLFSGSIGGAQWSAPEVLAGDSFAEASDVYSYGVLLWEMLTHDIPFRGMTDVQVSLAVLNQDQRPLIPQSCPPKLGKLIRVCWDKDPKRRPPFEQIARAFEGAICFPGTDPRAVEAYREQFAKGALPEIEEETASRVTGDEEEFNKMVQTLLSIDERESDSVLPAVAEMIKTPKWAHCLLQMNVIPDIVAMTDACSLASRSRSIVRLLNELLSVEELRASLIEHNVTEALLSLFMRFGTTSMPHFLGCLNSVLSIDGVKLTEANIAKLASFLLAGDITVRTSMMQILSKVVDKKAYMNEQSLVLVVPNVLENAIPEAPVAILSACVHLLNQLIMLDAPVDQLCKSDAALVVLPLTTHNYPAVAQDALSFIEKIADRRAPSVKFITRFVRTLPAVVTATSSDRWEDLLRIMRVASKNPAAAEAFAENPQSVAAFSKTLSSDNIAIKSESLKIVFVFLSNEKSSQPFISLLNDLLKHLSSKDLTVSYIAASCIVVAAASVAPSFGDILCDTLAEFIRSSLSKPEPRLKCAAFRLIGVLSSAFEGAYFLADKGCLDKIPSILGDGSSELVGLELMALTSFAGTMPSAPFIVRCLPAVSKFLDEPTERQCALLFMSSLAVADSGAEALVEFLPKVMSFSELPEAHSKVAEIVCRVLSCKSARAKISSKTAEQITAMLSTGKAERQQEVHIVGLLAQTPTSDAKSLKIFGERYLQQLETLTPSSPIYPEMLRTVERLGMC